MRKRVLGAFQQYSKKWMKSKDLQVLLDSIDKSLSDFSEYDSDAALENVLYCTALILALRRGDYK